MTNRTRSARAGTAVAVSALIISTSACSGSATQFGRRASTTTVASGSAALNEPSGSLTTAPVTAADSTRSVAEVAINLPTLADVEAPVVKPVTRTDEPPPPSLTDSCRHSSRRSTSSTCRWPTIPGATSTSLPDGDGFAAAYALQLIEAHRLELSPAQLAVVDSLFQQTLDDWLACRHDLVDSVEGYSVQISRTQPKGSLKIAGMATLPSTIDEYIRVITVYPLIVNGKDTDEDVKFASAHEIFHCVQYAWANNGAINPEWLIEGNAMYAALDLYHSTYRQSAVFDYDGWFQHPALGLTQGSGYDDWPLLETYLEQLHVDPYPAIKAMVAAGANQENTIPSATILKAGGFDNPVFESLWTSTSLRTIDFDDPSWELDWPCVNLQHGREDTGEIDNSSRGIGQFNVKGLPSFSHQQ